MGAIALATRRLFAFGRPRPVVLLGAFALVCVIGWLDYVTGVFLGLSLFYVVPVALVAWLGNGGAAALCCLASATVSVAGDLLTRPAGFGSVYPYANASLRFVLLLGVVAVVGALRQSLATQRRLALTDPLTGVSNARAFQSAAEIEIARVHRYGRRLALMYVDLDNFKPVNDRLGHSVGDLLLREIAETIQASVRTVDLVARIGGDEFVVLMPETSAEAAAAGFDRLRSAVVERMTLKGWPVTVSVGIVECGPQITSADELIAEADKQMYRAKRAGKDRAAVAPAGREAAVTR